MKTQDVKVKYVDKDVLWTEYPELIIKVSYINKNFGELNDFAEKYNMSGITNGTIFIYENLKNEPDPNIDYLKNVLESLGFIERRDFFSTQFYNKSKKEKMKRRSEIYELNYKYDWLICEEDETGISVRFNSSKNDIDSIDYPSLTHNNIPEDFTFSNYKLTDLESLDELPDINCWQITIVMRQEYIDGMYCNVLSHEGGIIWKESGGGWEFYERFLEIADILQEKYGKYLMDFVPDVDWLSIYGDSISGVYRVHDVRMKIRKAYHKIEKIKDDERREREKKEAAHRKKYMENERRKNRKPIWERIKNSVEQLNKFINEKKEEREMNKRIDALLKIIATEERKENPKNFYERLLNKLENWKKRKLTTKKTI